MDNQIYIRNFCIISHIDHGKSTLSDRFLEMTGTIPKEKMRPQYLDMMDLERERGVTIKMQPVRMIYKIRNPKSEILNKSQIQNSKSQTNGFEFRASSFEFSDSEFILNLIDTPGHVDFSYEVSRSLAAVEGAILLVDASKGIQAQTLANLEQAQKHNLIIIPAINKIDLPQARVEETKTELARFLKIPEEEIFEISAKAGTNVEKILRAVIEKIPPPKGNSDKPLKALIFDSKYDSFLGIISYVRIIDGRVLSGDNIYLIRTKTRGKVKELGYFKPENVAQKELKTGEMGYLATGVKETDKIRVGDTITELKIENEKFKINEVIEPLPGYKEPKPMVFASLFPADSEEFDNLKIALTKLKLNDAALVFEPENKEFLGRGYRCGFLGTFHIEIICERLRREFGLNLIISTPSVVFKIIDKKEKTRFVYSAGDWPEPNEVKEIQEPWVKLEVITPSNYLGQVLEILKNLKGNCLKTDYFGAGKNLLVYAVPLRKIITGFYDNLKNQSQGFASMNYEILEYRPAQLEKLEVLIGGKKEEALSKIIDREDAFKEGKKMVSKLKDVLPSQLFALSLQAAISGKIIARETIKAKRKDVTAPLYGGDYTRKMKLLEKQKKGKKKLKERGKLRIPQETFLEIFKI